MAGSLALRYARRNIQTFSDQSEDLMGRHFEAMDCRDCEAFLQLGIDAFGWLVRADQVAHAKAREDSVAEHQFAEIAESLRLLFRAWLGPCEFAENWIADQEAREYVVENAHRFREYREEVEAVVESFDSEDLATDALIALRDKAVADYRNGETAEFV